MKPWVVISIYTADLTLGKELARLALRAGADWIEVDTPLIVYRGVGAIQTIAEVCRGKPILADFKASDEVGKYCREAYRRGATVASVLGRVPDPSIAEAVRSGRENGVKILADMYSIRREDLSTRARQLEALNHDPSKRTLDGLKELKASVSIPVGVHTYTAGEAVDAVKMGASFVLQGMATPGESIDLHGEFLRVKHLIQAVRRTARPPADRPG
jgi:3-keto-L-gulonate-6-phosphate decarboxylase